MDLFNAPTATQQPAWWQLPPPGRAAAGLARLIAATATQSATASAARAVLQDLANNAVDASAANDLLRQLVGEPADAGITG